MGKNSLIKKGKIAEHKVISKLLDKGWNVYQNICDDNGIDFAIEKNDKWKKIQVKISTKTSLAMKKGMKKYERYSFRLGNTGIKADYYIGVMPKDVAIIPADSLGSDKSFFIFPNTRGLGFFQTILK